MINDGFLLTAAADCMLVGGILFIYNTGNCARRGAAAGAGET